MTSQEERTTSLPQSWSVVTVARVGTVRLGRQRSPDKQTGRFSTKYLRAANITANGLDLSDVLEMDFTPAERAVYALKQGDVVLAEASGTSSQVGRSALWNDEIPDCCFQNTVIRFRAHVALPEYALIVFRYYRQSGEFARIARGVGIQHLGVSRFAGMPFPLPPEDEQKRIVDEFNQRITGIQEAEKSLRSALRHIEEQRYVIFEAAASGELVEPEAVIAAREGRTIELPSVESELQKKPLQGKLFEEEDTSSSPPRSDKVLPPGWIWSSIGIVGDLKLGRQRSPEHEYGDHLIPYLRVANVQEDFIDYSNLTKMNFTPAEQEEYKIKRGDILLNVGQSAELVGRPALVREDVQMMGFQNHLVRFRSKPYLNPEYALFVFRYYLHSGVFRELARRTTNIATLSVTNLKDIPFPLPPLIEQNRIVSEAEKRLRLSKDQEKAVRVSLERINDMRAELLRAAASGLLVPHLQTDEPTKELLERRGVPPVEQKPVLSEGNMSPPLPERHDTYEVSEARLADILRSRNQPLRVAELFQLAGYDRNSIPDVEQFFLALRAELGVTLVLNGEDEDAVVEVLSHASRQTNN